MARGESRFSFIIEALGGKKAADEIDRVGDSVKRADAKVEDLDDSWEKTRKRFRQRTRTDGFDRVGEAADDVDTRMMGVRDGIDGVHDIMNAETPRDYAQGIGDIGSSIYNSAIPAIKSVRDRIAGLSTLLKTTMVGALGAVGAAVGAGLFLWDQYNDRQKKAEERAERLKAGIDAINGAIEDQGEAFDIASDGLDAWLEAMEPDDVDDYEAALYRLGYTWDDFSRGLPGAQQRLNAVNSEIQSNNTALATNSVKSAEARAEINRRSTELRMQRDALQLVLGVEGEYADAVAGSVGEQIRAAALSGDITFAKAKELEAIAALPDAIGGEDAALEGLNDALADGAAESEDFADAQQEAADMAKAHREELDGLFGVLLDNAGTQEAYRDALREAAEAIEEFNEAEEKTPALADSTADSIQDAAEAFATLDGQALDSEAGVHDLVDEMFRLARDAAPQVQDEVAQVISDLLQIPKDTVLNLMANADTRTAERQMASLARNRTSYIYASVANRQNLERYLQNLRGYADITPRVNAGPNGGNSFYASGGIAGDNGIAGENFKPEMVNGQLISSPTAVNRGDHIAGEVETADMLRRSGNRTTNVYNTTIHMPAGMRVDSLARTQARLRSREGGDL